MKYFKDENDQIFAFDEDGSQDSYIGENYTAVTKAQADAIISANSVPIAQVSRAQGKAALIQAGYWPSVVAFVEAIPDPTTKALAEVALYDTTNWQRNSPFLSTAAESLDISASELDQLFLVASQIQL